MTLNPADDAFAAQLREELSDDVLRPVEPRYLEEPRDQFPGVPGILALPRNTSEVSTLIRAANVARVGVQPYGGGTGLVAGQVMTDGPSPLIVSLERMNKVRMVYPQENVLVAEAGVILADVQAAALDHGRLFPLSLASEGSAQIGGNLSTNAGGVNVLRYGNMRDLCLGLEVVLPDGQIWNGLSRLRKDNTGYDLKNLLVGAEGTLGVITAASLKILPIPARIGTGMFVVRSPQAALDILTLARDHLGEGVSAFELIDGTGLRFLTETGIDVRQPFDTLPDWSVLIEIGLTARQDPEVALSDLFEAALDQGLAEDGVIAQNEAQRSAFWAVRERIPEANRRVGAIVSHDISIPIGSIPEFIDRANVALARIGDFRINCFGHVGDGNLHFNVFPAPGKNRATYAHQKETIKRVVHDLTAELEGSFSAEHGVGRLKVNELERYGDPVKLQMMRGIKAMLDPNGIMNPGAILQSLCE